MERPVPSDVAIILGAYTDGLRPSRTLRQRLRAGLDLYRLGYISYFIVSGGRGADETVTESQSMKRFLVLNGVPPQVILEEPYSSDTWENLLNSRRVMRAFKFRKAVIVTSDYHLPRALAVAKLLEMDVSGFAARSSQDEFRYAMREVLARILYTIKGRTALIRKGSS
jgi:vancomycin permeability regulator SanA